MPSPLSVKYGDAHKVFILFYDTSVSVCSDWVAMGTAKGAEKVRLTGEV